MFRSLLQPRRGISQSTPFWGPTFLLAHCSVFGSDTICNNLNPPLANIVIFGLPLKVFKTCARESFPHPYKECFVPFSNSNVGSHNPPPLWSQRRCWHSFPSPIKCGISQFTPFRAQCPRFYTVRCLAVIPFVGLLADIAFFGLSFSSSPSRF